MEPYNLPFIIKSSLSLKNKVLICLSVILFIAFSFFGIYLANSSSSFGDTIAGILCFLLFFILGIFFLYYFITVELLHKYYISLNEEGITVSAMYKKRYAKWVEIADVSLFEFNGNPTISILLEKDVCKRTKRSISNSINAMYNMPPASFSIGISMYKDIDIEKFCMTISQELEKSQHYKSMSIEEVLMLEEGKNSNNLGKALFFSFLMFIGSIIIYIVSLICFNINILVIPILTTFVIISVFNRYYIEESFNWKIRLYLSLICTLQYPISTVMILLLENKLSINLENINLTITFLLDQVKALDINYIYILIFSVLVFFMGWSKGRARLFKKDKQQ